MVDAVVNELLDEREVTHQAIAVELLSLAIDLDNPVVSMQVLAFALIVEIELMAR